ncbi:MAG TPA: YbaK/EbsC family protein [Thermoanaerobaculia bacterium]
MTGSQSSASTRNLSRSASRVQQALAAAGIESRVVELPQTTRSAQEAAAAIGYEVEQIAKSVVFRRVDTGLPVLVVLRGVDRVDTQRLAEHIGSAVERASPEFVREATGFAIGGVPPLGHERPVEIVIDAAILRHDVVWAAAGTPNAVFRAHPGQLAASATVLPVAADEDSR